MRPQVVEAVESLRRDPPGGLERALRLLQDTIFSFSLKVCGHRQDAEDTMQETLLKAARHLGRFDSPKALTVWLYKVAKNHCLMSRRRSRAAPRKTLSLDELLPGRKELQRLRAQGGHSPEQALLRKEADQHLQQAVLSLPPAYRLVLVLHDMEGLSTEEVARVLELREGTVRVRLHRARVSLRNQLVRRPGALPAPRTKQEARPVHCKQLFAELSDYLDGALDASLCEELEKHLDGCEPCQTFLDSLAQTVQLCRRHSTECLHPDAAARRREALLAEYQRALSELRRRR